MALRRVAGMNVGCPQPVDRMGHELHQQPAGPPLPALAGDDRTDAEADPARNLLRLAEILMCGLLETLARQRHDA